MIPTCTIITKKIVLMAEWLAGTLDQPYVSLTFVRSLLKNTIIPGIVHVACYLV